MKKFFFLLAAVCITTIAVAQNNNKTTHPKGSVNTSGGSEYIGDILDGVGIKSEDPKDKAEVVRKVKTKKSTARRRKR